MTVTAGRLESTFEGGRYAEEIVDEQTCTITSTDTVTNELVDERCAASSRPRSVDSTRSPRSSIDDDGRSNRAVYTQWVSGATARPTRDLTQGEV